MDKNRAQNKKEEAAEELRAQQEYLLEMGGLHEALRYLYRAIEKGKKKPSKNS